ncbi:hypothetical protein DW888_12570 [Bacteroides nordii]|uniref:Uncharacterized protein n=1 Tax=Bacteroides nordii TaxID=291645 RepID=A0A413VLA6_9BACE|nr:hypothetical protein DW888_12570 [Bacteroides nordii]
MVNTKNKASPNLSNNHALQVTRKRRLLPIRLLGSPQATIHYGKVYAYKVQLAQYVLVHYSSLKLRGGDSEGD